MSVSPCSSPAPSISPSPSPSPSPPSSASTPPQSLSPESTYPAPVLCDDAASCTNALSSLSSCTTLILDCEGVDLGTADGELCLLTLQAVAPQINPSPAITTDPPPSESPPVYIFDITTLKRINHDLQPVFRLLTSPSILKIVWDGRMDYSALHHSSDLHVDLNHVLDLQVVDLHSRTVRGEGKADHLKRLRDGCVLARLLQRDDAWWRYRNVRRVSSLLQAVKEHRPEGFERFKKDRVNHNLWSTRPLPAEHLKYAATDIHMIASLHAYFLARKYITPKSREPLLTESERYITYWSDRQPSGVTRNYFEQNPFLPLELIDDPGPLRRGGRQTNEPEHEPATVKKMCKKCKRALSQGSFNRAGWTKTSLRCCWVCWAVTDNLWHWKTRDRMMQKKDEERARRELESASSPDAVEPVEEQGTSRQRL
ncbi:uncharacterized protein STEHIDRAFT_154302 [Stereum hirsutum FP-91666 SS1]|uniref:uncharacterized protein n=1 Tax=Stereum hirsutum (strain FP-91666) TaxID=721885 RepID=UPI000440EEF1|nr:uncharacterized protein STEHIDRAFT_154302 [Stereum hirsutum FP-91666 SS1]EIM90484.1 hypothetical protein STEHIDRAFT_154302 [Stereum hirsutum FP-91666 SS1]